MNHTEVKRRQIQMISYVLAFVSLYVFSHIIDYNGVTYMLLSLEICAFLLSVLCSGLSDTLGRIIRVRNAKGQGKNAAAIRKNAMLIHLVLGLLVSISFLFLSEKLASFTGVQYSKIIMNILVPALFLRSVSSVLLGYVRGEGFEFPAVVSEILRQVFILFFGILLGKKFGTYGEKVSALLVQNNYKAMYGCVGIAIGIVIAEILVTIYLGCIFYLRNRKSKKKNQDNFKITDSIYDSGRILFSGRIFPACYSLLALLPFISGFMFLAKSTMDSNALALQYGVYLSTYMVPLGIVISLIYLVIMLPICGRTLALLRKEEHRMARSHFQSGVHFGIVHALFFTSFFAVMAPQLSKVWGRDEYKLNEKMLMAGSSFVLFGVIILFFLRVLVVLGKKGFVMTAVIVADVSYAVSVAIFLNFGKAEVLALVYGGLISSFVLAMLTGLFSYKCLRQKPDWLNILLIPVIISVISGFLARMLAKLLLPHMGDSFTVLICLIISGCIYWTGLVLARNFREIELEYIPGGKILNAVGQMMKIY